MTQRLTVLECEGIGLVVQGSAFSVGLCLGDAERLGERVAWLLGPHGDLVGVDPSVAWDVAELHEHA